MVVSHLSASLSRNAGGIFEIELALAKALLAHGVIVSSHGLEDDGWKQDCAKWAGLEATVYAPFGPRAFGWSPLMVDGVLADRSSLAHLHCLWMYPSIAVSIWSETTGNPYIVTPNGMLEPWALGQSAWKKKLASFFYQHRILCQAACLQANTVKELRDFRAYGLKNPVCVIPNGVSLPDLAADGGHGERGKRTLLFLGRLHPKKGLVNALRAWARIEGCGGEWQFAIAGWDQGGHEAELRRLCDELGLTHANVSAEAYVARAAPDPLVPVPGSVSAHLNRSAVVFLGPAFGETKDALLRSADAFILPSFSEGLPMAVLEAWAYRLPVLMTDHCNLPEGFKAGAAVRIGTEVDSITDGLHQIISATYPQRHLMGDCGRALVERQFTWPQVAAQMKEVYDWVLGGGAKPSCVE
jgi:glycosyltransferase involved in cell wall biosynthesis